MKAIGSNTWFLLSLLIVAFFGSAAPCRAESETNEFAFAEEAAENHSDVTPPVGAEEPAHGIMQLLNERETLTDNWFSFGKTLEELGITTSLGLTQVYQVNLQGGGVENSWGEVSGLRRRKGRYTGSYDWVTLFDLEKLANIPGATVFTHVEGGWSRGLNDSSVGALLEVNGDAYGDAWINLTELYWEQTFFSDRIRFRLGKMDLLGGYTFHENSAAFDCNAYANDETGQFLNAALVNNPSVPFPDRGLGVSIIVEPIERWYVSAACVDAQAVQSETGFNTTFHGEDNFFAVVETGYMPVIETPWGKLPGGYRGGMWYDPQGKDRYRAEADLRTITVKRDDVGFYLSFDQALFRENSQDDQGLGAFFRYGWADRDVNDLCGFWSTGFQYQGVIPSRDDDVLGVGYANGKRGDNPDFTAHHEQAWEFYYSVQLTPWLQITPSLQYLNHPGMDRDISDAVVAGIRAQMEF